MTQLSAAPVYQAGQWVEGPRQLKSVTTFDVNGNEIEFAAYDPDMGLRYRLIFSHDANGIETGVTTFSEAEEETRRVATVYNPSERTVAWSRQDANGKLTREVLSTFDAQGKETEDIHYRRKPGTEEMEIGHKHSYTYSKDGLLLEELSESYSRFVTKTLFAYDPQGNLIQSKDLERIGERFYSSTVTSYTYEQFDTDGNWTKRVKREAGGGGHDQFTVEYRTFTYR